MRYDLPGFGTRSESVGEACGATLESLAAEAGDIVDEHRRAGDRGRPEPRHAGRRAGRRAAPRPGARTGAAHPRPAGRHAAARRGGRAVRRPRRRPRRPAQLARPNCRRTSAKNSSTGSPTSARPSRPTSSPTTSTSGTTGCSDAPAMSAFGGPVLIIRGGADAFVDRAARRCRQPALRRSRRQSHRQGRPLGARRVPRGGRGDDPRLHRCDREGDTVSRPLRHKVFVTKQIPQSGRGPLPTAARGCGRRSPPR